MILSKKTFFDVSEHKEWKCQIHSPLFLSIENSTEGEERAEIGYDCFKHKAVFAFKVFPLFIANISWT